MTQREVVLEQIKHHPTEPVPYTLSFEGDVEERLDQHYGGKYWRERFVEYIASCCAIDRRKSEHDPVWDSCGNPCGGRTSP